MKKTALTTISALLTGLLCLMACSKSSSGSGGGGGTDVCAAVTAKFATDVLPLMQTKCSFSSGCHGTGSTNSGGVLLTYAQISAKSATIKSQVAGGMMPKSGSITTVEKNIIICWVNSGALNN